MRAKGKQSNRFRIATALVAVNLLSACAMLDEFLPVREDPDVRDARALSALSALNELREIDAFVKLDNNRLAEQIGAELDALARGMEGVQLTQFEVRFLRQHIALEGEVLVTGESGGLIGSAR